MIWALLVAQEIEDSSWVERAQAAVVMIHAYDEWGTGGGTGFFVDPWGYILTNAHVVTYEGKREPFVYVITGEGRVYEAAVLAMDTLVDIALLKVWPEKPHSYLRLADTSEIRPGDPVALFGFPYFGTLSRYGYSPEPTITRGNISAIKTQDIELDEDTLEIQYIQTDAAINPGNSGGPLVLEGTDLVVGMAAKKMEKGEGMGFAISAWEISRFLHGVPLQDAETKKPPVVFDPDSMKWVKEYWNLVSSVADAPLGHEDEAMEFVAEHPGMRELGLYVLLGLFRADEHYLLRDKALKLEDKYPYSPIRWLYLAKAYTALSRFDSAAHCAAMAWLLEKERGTERSYTALSAKELLDSLRSEAERLEQRGSRGPDLSTAKGLAALVFGSYGAAVEYLGDVLLEREGDPIAVFWSAYVLHQKERSQKALVRLAEAQPPTPEILWLRSKILMDLGRAREAAQVADSGLRLWPEDQRLRAQLARALLAEGMAESALVVLDSSLVERPGSYWPLGHLRVKALRLAGKEAAPLAERLLARMPWDPDLLYQYTMVAQGPPAIAALGALAFLTPREDSLPEAYVERTIGKKYQEMGKWWEAARFYARGKDREGALSCAQEAKRTSGAQDAALVLETYLRLNPDDSLKTELLRLYGRGKPESVKALRAYLANVDPCDCGVRYRLAHLLSKRSKKEARLEYARMISIWREGRCTGELRREWIDEALRFLGER